MRLFPKENFDERAGVIGLDRLSAAERVALLTKDPDAWNKLINLRNVYNQDRLSLSLKGGGAMTESGLPGLTDLRGVDLSTLETYHVNWQGCDLTGAKVGPTLAVRKLSDLFGVEGVIVMPKGPKRANGKTYIFPFSVIVFNAADGVKVFQAKQATMTEDAGHQKNHSQPEVLARQISSADQNTRAGIKAACLEHGWNWRDSVLAVEPGRRKNPVRTEIHYFEKSSAAVQTLTGVVDEATAVQKALDIKLGAPENVVLDMINFFRQAGKVCDRPSDASGTKPSVVQRARVLFGEVNPGPSILSVRPEPSSRSSHPIRPHDAVYTADGVFIMRMMPDGSIQRAGPKG